MIDAVRLYVSRSRSARRLHGVGSWRSWADWCIDYAVRGLVWAAGSRQHQENERRQDKAGGPAAVTALLIVCLHIVFCAARLALLSCSCGAHVTFWFVFNAQSAIARDV